ncbi:response regulator transcription factor [Marinobacteraceae bacterium S3BR75-40.1]
MSFAMTADGPLARILIVDDHPFYANGLAQVLQSESLAREVICRPTVASAMDVLRASPDIDLILLDLSLPEEGGLALFQALDQAGLPVPVVIISSREDETSVRAAKAAGALGFFPKSADAELLRRMLQRVMLGDTFFPRTLSPIAASEGRLTPRQRDVLKLLSAGHPNKRICQELGLTEHTVKSHLKALFQHLNVHNRTECVTVARELGLVE